MPSVSKQQQKLFGLVRALQKGDVPPGKVSKQVKDLAKNEEIRCESIRIN